MLKKILPKNISNKALSLIILILILTVGLLILYFGLLGKQEPQELTIKTGKPGDLRLVKFLEDVPATDFSKNDRIGVEGNLKISEQEILTFQIIDRKGQEVQRGELKILRQDDKLRMCCVIPPEKAGSYILELFLNGEKAPIFPILFNVSPQ